MGLFKKNSTPYEDVMRAMGQWLPISASSFAKANISPDVQAAYNQSLRQFQLGLFQGYTITRAQPIAVPLFTPGQVRTQYYNWLNSAFPQTSPLGSMFSSNSANANSFIYNAPV